MESCIASLAVQGPDVFVWAAKEHKRSGDNLKEIPSFFEDYPNVTVAIVEDRGPITKLLPALEAGYELIITADDDHTYGYDWAEGLVMSFATMPYTAICYRGRIFDKSKLYSNSRVIINTVKQVDFITGVCGAIYHRDFFRESIFSEWRNCSTNDDIVISAHLKKHHVPMYVVPMPEENTVGRLPIHMTQPLSKINVRGGLNDKGLRKVYWR